MDITFFLHIIVWEACLKSPFVAMPFWSEQLLPCREGPEYPFFKPDALFPFMMKNVFNALDVIDRTDDECCGKIDLFRVQNRVAHILPWWDCCQGYQTEGLFHGRSSDFWLFWHQIYDCTSNRTNSTQFWGQNIAYFLTSNRLIFAWHSSDMDKYENEKDIQLFSPLKDPMPLKQDCSFGSEPFF